SVGAASVPFTAQANTNSGGNWLSVTPQSGATPAPLSIGFSISGLQPGVYTGNVTVSSGSLNPVVVTVTLSVITDAGLVLQVSPASLAFSYVTGGQVPATFNVQTAPVLPAITQNGVVNAANLSAAISPGTWVSIFGGNLSATTRPWRDADFVNGKLPTALDGVGVTINGKPAAVAYVSPTQINVLAPDETATGLVAVQVTGPAGT